MFNDVPCLSIYFVEHGFGHWFVKNVYLMLNVCSIPVPFAHAACKPSETIRICMFEKTSENMNFYNVHDFIRHLFRHWLLMTSGIDFGFILEPFNVIFMFFRDRVVDDLLDGLFIDLNPKHAPTLNKVMSPFPHFADSSATFSRPSSDIDSLFNFDSPFADFGAHLVPCCSLWAPCYINVGRFRHL